jgi:8-oxo-dGTP diphosphatase
VTKKHNTATPYIACFTLLRREGKIAFVLRKNTGYMDDCYGLPAGKVEWKEDFKTGAIREAKEEAGVIVAAQDLRFVHIMHRTEDSDWVDVFFETEKWIGEPYNAEPHKSSELAWLDPANLPQNLVPSVREVMQYIANGELYSTFGF